MRTATVHRATAETVIDVTVNLDGTGVYQNAPASAFSITCSTSCRGIR